MYMPIGVFVINTLFFPGRCRSNLLCYFQVVLSDSSPSSCVFTVRRQL